MAFFFFFNTPSPQTLDSGLSTVLLTSWLQEVFYIFEVGVSVASSFGDASSTKVQAVCLRGCGFLVMSSLPVLLCVVGAVELSWSVSVDCELPGSVSGMLLLGAVRAPLLNSCISVL